MLVGIVVGSSARRARREREREIERLEVLRARPRSVERSFDADPSWVIAEF